MIEKTFSKFFILYIFASAIFFAKEAEAAQTNQDMRSQWSLFIRDFRNKGDEDFFGKCVIYAVEQFSETSFQSNDNDKILIAATPQLKEKIGNTCSWFSNRRLNQNYNCKLNDGSTGECSDSYYSVSSPSQPLSIAAAILSALKGEQISIGSWATEKTIAEQLKKNEDEKQRNLAIAKRAAEEKARQEWLMTPEGKKYLADEAAKATKAREDRQKAEAQEKARVAKLGPAKFKVFKKREWVEGWGKAVNYVVFQSLDGDVIVNKITLNRDNCSFNYIMLDQRGAIFLPHKLNFSESLKIEIRQCELLEASIETNRGNQSFSFN